MTPRPSTAAPILAVLAIVLPFVLYVGGYFWLGRSYKQETLVERYFQHRWQVVLYRPAGQLEAYCLKKVAPVPAHIPQSQRTTGSLG
jgi:hypothetical protein